MINGLLLPGGGADLEPGHQFFDTARRLVDLAIKANDNGDYFPVRGSGGRVRPSCLVYCARRP